jgi:NAD-dependent deacetylase
LRPVRRDRHLGSGLSGGGVCRRCAAAGARTLEINLAPSEIAALFDEHLSGPAGETVPVWVDRLLSGGG